MASELKPCPFCGAAAKAKPMGSASFTVMCENLHRINSFGSKAEAIEAWNTRPAPAATDAGLETVAHQYRWGGDPKWRYFGPIFADEPRETRALCLRSQAESEIRKVRQDAEELLEKHIDKLKADNAAAEKVREAAIELDEAISDDFNIFGAQQKLRAALGGKS